MSERLRILFLAANPSYMSDVDWRTEHRLLRNTLHENVEAANCEMVAEHAARPTELQMALATFKPHVVHFAGHGNDEGIYLEDDDGASFLLSKEWLELLFSFSLKHLRLIVLNSCWSESQIEKLGRLVDYVVGTNDAIEDEAALIFTAHFYGAIAVGKTVREAFMQATGKLADGTGKERVERYRFLVRPGAHEDRPLLPPAEGSNVMFKPRELKAVKTVIAEQIERGPNLPAQPRVGPPGNRKNKVEVITDKADVGELYVATEYRETSLNADEEGDGRRK